MFSLIRGIVSLVVLIAFIVFATTVPLGQRTLFGHVARIWQADETQELVDGVKESSGPVVDKVKRGVQAGIDEATREPMPSDKSGEADASVADRSAEESADTQR